MRYGYFDEENKEYVIIRPDTPTPWMNYLGLDEYCALISNTAGGYSFHKDPRDKRILLRLSIFYGSGRTVRR